MFKQVTTRHLCFTLGLILYAMLGTPLSVLAQQTSTEKQPTPSLTRPTSISRPLPSTTTTTGTPAGPTLPVTEDAASSVYQSPVSGMRGVLVETLEGQVLMSESADQAFNPASAVKLATALSAIRTFGIDHRFTTGVWTDGHQPDGRLESASGTKPRVGGGVSLPFVRGPLRLAEAFAVLPAVKRGLPGARMPYERPAVAVALVAASTGAGLVRRSSLPVLPREAVAMFASLVPALVALRGDQLTSPTTVPSTSRSARTRRVNGRPRSTIGAGRTSSARCSWRSAVAGAAAELAPKRHRTAARFVGAVGAVGAAVEVFGWMGRNADRRLSRALSRPGTELQRRVSTSEPSAAQLEVANAALEACLAAEQASS